MSFVKLKTNAFIFSILNTCVIISIVLFFLFLFCEQLEFSLYHDRYYIIGLFLTIITFSYLLFLFAFKKQVKQNFTQIIKDIPIENQATSKIDIKNVRDSIKKFKDNKELEILLLKDRENYRREFFGNVAHELKTPLFSMQGYTHTLIEGGINDLNIRDKYLERISKSLDRLTYIINDLDLLFDLENQNLKLNIAPFNIIILTNEIIDLLEHKAQKNKVKVLIHKNSKKDIFVNADSKRIAQVLTNLLSNGISYSGKNTTIEISFEIQRELVKISIKDNGIGIKPEHLNRLFERFYRVDVHRSRNEGGSGLGLSIVKNILQAHNQDITVKSIHGKGTEFTFFLDRAK